MQLIKSIEIRYLRSIHRLRVNARDLTIFSGANDVGKSNILKTLNLFFNNKVDWLTDLDFYQDFSLRRLNEVRRESIKGRQFIRIDVQFARPSNYEGSLPPTFKVAKTWFRDSLVPEERNDLERQDRLGRVPSTLETARRMLSQFLNRIRFEYVPAIRDVTYFDYVLGNLQETMLATQMKSDDPILVAVGELNASLRERAGTLRGDFERATGIEADVSLPVDPNALFQAFTVNTRWQDQPTGKPDEQQMVSLSLRGDGIQARYVPSLLKYIADNSSLFYVWGFEEPENSVEYNLAIELATQFEQIYSTKAQVFVTSHSPAFVSLRGLKTVSYRVYMTDNTTKLAQVHPPVDEVVLAELSQDIGLFRLQKETHERYLQERSRLLETEKRVEELQAQLEQSSKPVVYVEGKTDAAILSTAWDKLAPEETMPFDISSCDPLPEGVDGGAGGAETLRKFLSTVREDSPHIAIGIFDRDQEGITAYKRLPKYFKEVGEIGARVSLNGKAAAMLLPVPPGKEEYVNFLNMVIEFYFSEQALSRRTDDGYGLTFRQPEIQEVVRCSGAPVLHKRASDLPHTRQVVDGKRAFAESIVPGLDTVEFEHFSLIFDKICAVLDCL